MKRLIISIFILSIILMSAPATNAAGTTVIVHGLNWGLNDDLDQNATWTLTMASAIANRLNGGIVYTIENGVIERRNDLSNIPGGAVEANLEKIVVLSWVYDSHRPFFGFSEGAADLLYATLLYGASTEPVLWDLDQLHFIGHSRGTIVISETIQRFGLLTEVNPDMIPDDIGEIDANIQFTTLDAHPWNSELSLCLSEPLNASDDDVNSEIIGRGVVCWENVGYADNFYQTDCNPLNSVLSGLGYFPGIAYTLHLTSRLSTHGGNGHSQVHAWYHGTIDPGAENDGVAGDELTIYDDWYNGDEREAVGFNKAISVAGSNQVGMNVTSGIAIEDDETLYPGKIFNGDFSMTIGVPEIIDPATPGWRFDIPKDAGEGKNITDGYLRLDWITNRATHDRLFVPQNTRYLTFSMKVANGGDDQMYIYLGSDLVASFELSENEDWHEEVIPFASYAGRADKLIFLKDPNDILENDSEVHLDNIEFVLEESPDNSNIPHAVLQGLYWLKESQETSKSVTVQFGGESATEGISPANTDDVNKDISALGSWRYGSTSNAGITALALQAFLNAGITVDHPEFGTTVENAINYLVSIQIPSGYHAGVIANYRYGYETAMAVVALKSALKTGLRDGHPLRPAVENAANLAMNYYTQDFQESWGSVSWRYDRSYTNSYGERNNGDMSVNQWVYLALDAMNYDQKGVWQNVYGYLNVRKCVSGDGARVGYTSCNTRSRGNTLAGVWGSVLAGQYGVTEAPALADQMLNYIDDWCGVNSLMSPPSITTYCVVTQAGYYYYIYELAKALEMSTKNQFCGGEDWGEIMYERLENQHLETDDGYYWNPGHYDPYNNNSYYIGTSGPGPDGSTALALLAMEAAIGVIPPGSRLLATLNSVDPGKDISGAYLVLYDESGRYAGPDTEGNWYSDIPQGVWMSTTNPQEFELGLNQAQNLGVEIHNDGPDSFDWELCLKLYTPGQVEAVDSVCFTGSVAPNVPLGTRATIDAVGGLSVRAPYPGILPCPDVSISELAFAPLVNDTLFTFSFEISEVCGITPLSNIDIIASDLTNAAGDLIPKANFTFAPSHIDDIAAGGSVEIQGTLLIPNDALLDLSEIDELTGVITIETGQVTRSIAVSAHTCSPNLVSMIMPNPIYTAILNHVGSISFLNPVDCVPDSFTLMDAPLYVGGFDELHPVDNIVHSTVRINNDLLPGNISAVKSVDCYLSGDLIGSDVLELEFDLREFLSGYGDLYDSQTRDYTITGEYSDGSLFIACGEVVIRGHVSGDLNSDGNADITDLTLMVDFLFRGEELPGSLESADYNHDGAVDITDLTNLVDYLFRG